MITISKNTKDPFAVEYKLEVYKDDNLLYHMTVDMTVDIGKHGIKDEERDKIAKLKLVQTLLNKGPIEIIEELGNLIPVYEE